MPRKKIVKKGRVLVKAAEVLTQDQLEKCRLVKVFGSNLLMLAPQSVLADPENKRYIHQVSTFNNKPVYSDGLIRRCFFGLNMYDPSDWHSHFKNIEKTLSKQSARSVSA